MRAPDPDQFHLFHGQAASAIEPAAVTCTVLPTPEQLPVVRLCTLGSGSGGNCTAISVGADVILIDAGFGPRTTAKKLLQREVALSQVKAICLTHLDTDHFRPHWIPTLIRWRIPIYIHQRHVTRYWSLENARELHDEGLVKIFTSTAFSPLADVMLHPIRLAHDREGTCAFRIHTLAGSLGYATDLGHVPQELIAHFQDVDLLALESNYDVRMQLLSARPGHLKKRIMGGAGHLSNVQCMEAIRELLRLSTRGGPWSIVLLHRSRQCNCPNLLRQLYEVDDLLRPRMTLSDQDAPTQWIDVSSMRA